MGEYPAAAIDYLTMRATGECRWFPTIADCKTIIADWRRDDEAMQRKSLASTLEWREKSARRDTAGERQSQDRWRPEPGVLERIKAEVASAFPSNRA